MAVTQTYLTAEHLINVNRAGPSEPDTVISGALEAAVCLIEDYASGAPDEMKREAGVRLASWLLEARGGGGLQSGNPSAESGAFRKSGAQSLLHPWHVRRALRVEESDA